MCTRNADLLPTLHRLTAALALTAWVSADYSPAQGLKLSIESYPVEIRKDLADPYAKARANPENADAVGSLGRTLQAWEQWEAAHEVYTRAISLAPDVI